MLISTSLPKPAFRIITVPIFKRPFWDNHRSWRETICYFLTRKLIFWFHKSCLSRIAYGLLAFSQRIHFAPSYLISPAHLPEEGDRLMSLQSAHFGRFLIYTWQKTKIAQTSTSHFPSTVFSVTIVPFSPCFFLKIKLQKWRVNDLQVCRSTAYSWCLAEAWSLPGVTLSPAWLAWDTFVYILPL